MVSIQQDINSKDYDNKVAVIGYSFRLPKNNTPDQLFQTLKDKIDCIEDATEKRWSKSYTDLGYIKSKYAGLVDLEEWKQFDPLFFGINPSEANAIDCQQRLLLKCVYEAFENSYIDPTKLRGSNTSVFIGSTTADFQSQYILDVNKNVNLFNNNLHTISNRISYCFDFRGSSFTIDSACSSSLNSVLLGCKTILEGESDLSVVGGCNLILDPISTKTASYLGAIGSSGKCKSFDEDADGFVRSEGVACVILKRLSNAIRDGDKIHCIINGGSSSHDGGGNIDKNSLYSPSKQSQYQNIMNALKNSNVNPSNIVMVEAHGTGTKVGDPIECEAISMALKDHFTTDHPLYIGSIKSNIGHGETCSGIASLIKCCLMFENRQLLPNINFNTPNSSIKFNEWKLKVITHSIPFDSLKLNNTCNDPISILINNYGITGSNATLIVSEFSNYHLKINQDQLMNGADSINNNQDKCEKEYLIPFSANSKKSLESFHFKLYSNYDYLSSNVKFKDFLKYQIYSRSLYFLQRVVIVSKNWDMLKTLTVTDKEKVTPQSNESGGHNIKLKILTENNKSSNLNKELKNPPLVFIFSGQGSQTNKMANELYNSDKVFRESMDNIDNVLSKYYGYSILNQLRSISDDDLASINDPFIAQPSLFIIQVSLFNLYKHWGIKPDIIVGHSFGEVSSAYCSGILSLDTACYIVYERSRLQHKTVGSGRMLSISISEQDFKENYSSKYPSLEISCINSPSSIVVSGNENDLNQFLNILKQERDNIFTSMLGTYSSFHTSSQESIKEELLNINQYEFNHNPNITTFSTVTGNQFNKQQQFTREYLYENLRNPVLFSKAMFNIIEYIKSNNLGSSPIFLEVSPHPVLLYYVKQIISSSTQDQEDVYFNQSSILHLSSLNNKSKVGDIQEIQTTISKLYCGGYNVDFTCQFSQEEMKDLSFKLTCNSGTDKIPNYQFDDKPYWNESKLFLKRRLQGPPTSQLGSENETSPFISRTSIMDLKNEPFQFYKNHQVKGKFFLPGCSYITNIIILFKSKDINITQLEFKTPLILTEGSNKYLQTNIYKTSRNEFKALFHFKDDIDNDNPWIQTATGKILQMDHSNLIVEEKHNIKQLKSKCNYTKVKKFEFYIRIKAQTGLGYTGSFQRVEKCYVGKEKTLTKVSLHPSNSLTDNEHFFNPAILDSCLHGMVGGFDGHSQIVFDRVEDYKVYSKNIPSNRDDHTHIYVYSEAEGRFGDSYYSSILIMLKDGTPLIEASRIVCTSLIPIKDNLNIEYPIKSFFTFNLQPKDSQTSTIIQSNQSNHCSGGENNNDISNNIGELIKCSLKSILNKKYVIRILELKKEQEELEPNDNSSDNNNQGEELNNSKDVNLNLSNTINILKQINQLYENESLELDIEYTITNCQEELIREIKNQLSFFKGSLIFKTININEPVLQDYIPNKEQSIIPSYYDFVLLLPESIESVKSLEFTLSEIFKLLTPNGKFLFTPFPSLPSNDNIEYISKEIGYINYNNSICSTLEKPKIFKQLSSLSKTSTLTYDQVLIFSGESNSDYSINFKSKLNSVYSSYNSNGKIKEFRNIEEFNDYTSSNQITNNSIIYFISTIDQLTEENFKKVTFDYVNINQYLLKENKQIKHVLVTRYAEKESNNYLAGSVVGAMTFFHEVQSLLFLVDFDDESINSSDVIEKIEILINPNSNIHREYVIRNNQAYFERAKLERFTPKKFKSTTYQNDDNLYARLDSNLEYYLDSKDQLLDDCIEIQVKSIGINFKDNLIYRGLVPPELRSSKGADIHKPEFGYDVAGIITRVGGSVTEFKVGDSVFGLTRNAASSHVIDNSFKFILKPSHLSFSEAASIPSVYLTCLYSLLKVGHLSIKNQDSILIHSATGGVGLAAISILKFLGFKSQLFCTVSSKEKEDYLRSKYGDFITGIFSSKDSYYVKGIKEKLKEIGSKKTGVDIILNTLSNEFFDSNFKVLQPMGRYVDLSITHLNIHEYTDFNKFKYNLNYHSIEITQLPPQVLIKLMKKLSSAFESQHLELIPINEYSVSNIKDAIEFIGERKNIGKIVINIDKDLIQELLEKRNQSNQIVLKPKSQYEINSESLGETILVTGQDGLILELLKWICSFSHTVKHIIVLSRSDLKWVLEYLINKINYEYPGKIKFYFKSVDVSVCSQIENAIDTIYNENSNLPPIDVIFHFAFSYTNVFEPKFIDMNHIEISHSAKTHGALNLHNLSIKRNWKLKNFITTSSIASAFGSTNQMGYVSSNSVLDSLARYRNSIGLPVMNVNFGLVGSAGIITKQVSIAKLLEGQGISNISCGTFLGSIDLLLQNSINFNSDLMIHNFNYDALENNAWPYKQIKYKYDYLFNSLQSRKKLLNKNESSIRDDLINKIAETLSIEPSRLNLENRIIDMGFDSLAVVQFKNWLDKNYAENIFTIVQLQSLTIGQIIQTIINKVSGNTNSNSSINSNKANNSDNITGLFKPTFSFDNLINWDNEIKLDQQDKSNIEGLLKPIESITNLESLSILLTGCTGYLGSHILAHLLRIIYCKEIYCLVRGVKNIKEAKEIIQTKLQQHEINETEFKKIIPVIGDLEKEKFGLSENEYQHLSKSVHLIINLASNNNINSTYNECKSTNVNGVKELIKLSTSISFKRIVHISPSFLSFNQNITDQQQLPIFSNEENNFNGYLNSKSVSEHLINNYSQEYNIPNMILRSPFIISNPNSIVSSIIESCLSVGFYPIDIPFRTNTSSVQWLSETMINTIFNDNNWIQKDNNNNSGNSNALNVFNIVGEPITLKEIFSIICKDFPLSPIEFNDWVSKLKSSNHNSIINNNNKNNYLDFIKFNPNNYKESSPFNNSNNNNNNNTKTTQSVEIRNQVKNIISLNINK